VTVAELPTPEILATLVSNVTETMFGLRFELEQGAPNASRERWRAALLPIAGPRPLTVAIATDEQSCVSLGGAMFSCAPGAVDSSMIDDTLTELVNIVAGQVKAVLSLDQPLGLPRIVDPNSAAWAPLDHWRSATLTRGGVRSLVWVAVTERLL
jgi:hypothetical protein